MSSDDPGAQSEPPNQPKDHPAWPGQPDCGADMQAHQWVEAWVEPLGVMWVCERCGRDWLIHF